MTASLTDVKVEIPGTNGLLEYWERSLFLKDWSTGLLLLGEIPTGVLGEIPTGEIPKGLEYWERSLLEYWERSLKDWSTGRDPYWSTGLLSCRSPSPDA